MFSSLVLFTACAYSDSGTDECCGLSPRPQRAGVRHIEGKGIGYGKGYTSLDLFLGKRLANDAYFPFFDLRGHAFDDGKLAANAGVGYRVLDAKRIWGVNAYYDYRNASRLHYNQVGIGLESLGKTWDFHCNGYLPLGKNHSSWKHPKFDRFKGNSIYLRRNQEFAMWGIDTEAGAHCNKSDNWDLYGGGGPYYFGNHGKNAWGFKARASATYKQFIYLEASGSYDNIFNTIGQVEIGFSLPFGPRAPMKRRSCGYQDCCSLAVLEHRLVQPVLRQEIIVEAKRHRRELAIDPATGLPFNVLFVDNESHSLGTFESPYNTLADALAASSPGDIVYMFPGDGTTNGLNAFGTTFQLQDNQQILGAGTAQPLQTTLGAVVIPAHAEGMPYLTADATVRVVTLANNTTAAGLHVAASESGLSDNYCIGMGDSASSSTTQNATIRNNYLEALTGANGIFSNASGVLIMTDNLIYLTPEPADSCLSGGGIFINYNSGDESTTTCSISGNTITSTLPGICVAQSGININVVGGNRTFDIRNNNISIASTGIGIQSIGGVSRPTVAATIVDNVLTDNTVSGIGYTTSAISSFGSDNFCVIQNNLIQNTKSTSSSKGIRVETNFDSVGTYNISFNTIKNADNGISTESQSSDNSRNSLVIQNNWIQNTITGLTVSAEETSIWTCSIGSNTLTRFLSGVSMSIGGNSTVTASVENNEMFNSAVSGQAFGAVGFGASVTQNSTGVLNIVSNNFMNLTNSVTLNTGGNAISCVAIEDNTMRIGAGEQLSGAIGVSIIAESSNPTNIQILSNYFENNDDGGVSIRAVNNNGGGVCLQFLNNQSPTDQFQFEQQNDPFRLVGVASGNTPVPVVISGSVTPVGSCGTCP